MAAKKTSTTSGRGGLQGGREDTGNREEKPVTKETDNPKVTKKATGRKHSKKVPVKPRAKKKTARKKSSAKAAGKSSAKQNSNTTGRRKNGKWVKGYTPEGAKPWKPGQSGNPKGRPKGKLLTDIIRDHLFDPVTDKDGNPVELAEGVPMTRADLVVRKCVERAMEGSFHHLKELLERIDGKVPSKLEADVRNKESVANLMIQAAMGTLPKDEE